MDKKIVQITLAVIAVVGSVLFVLGIGDVHLFDWDEINFAESAREMMVTGDYLNVRINYEVFWEKPPLFIWLQALSMHLFGVNEFAARFPNVIAGVLTLSVLYLIGRRMYDHRFGVTWAVMYACSFLPFFYFKTAIIDPWFNLFIFLGIYFMMLYTSGSEEGAKRVPASTQLLWASLSAVFLGLATLTKGPVGFLIFLLVFGVYLVRERWRIVDFRWRDVVLFVLLFALVGGLWFILQILTGNLSIMEDFIVYQIRLLRTQDAGHGGFPGYHFVILLLGVFPASIFALPTMRRGILKHESSPEVRHFFRWMMITLWVVLILFSIVRTKIVHYSSMCYFPITFLATWYVTKWREGAVKLPRWCDALLLGISTVVGAVAMAIPFIDNFKHLLIPYIEDEFARHNLQATSTFMGWESITGLLLIVAGIYFVATRRKQPARAIRVLLSGALTFIFLGSWLYTPQVERYSQRAAIDFFKSKATEDCYIYPLYKSYAHYFYGRVVSKNVREREYLMRGDLDKPAYFVLRKYGSAEEDFVREVPDAVRLYEENGFIFYYRK